jgi:hypothetical protein
LLPAYQNELVIAADTPMAVSLSSPWTVTAPNPLGSTPTYNALGYTVAAGTYTWRNDLVWVDSDGDGRLTLKRFTPADRKTGQGGGHGRIGIRLVFHLGNDEFHAGLRWWRSHWPSAR